MSLSKLDEPTFVGSVPVFHDTYRFLTTRDDVTRSVTLIGVPEATVNAMTARLDVMITLEH